MDAPLPRWLLALLLAAPLAIIALATTAILLLRSPVSARDDYPAAESDVYSDLYVADSLRPYLPGARVELRVLARYPPAGASFAGASLQSRDPSVFLIESQEPWEGAVGAAGRAVSPGVAVIEVVQGGRARDAFAVRVVQPDEARLVPPNLANDLEEEPPEPLPLVYAGGSAAFLVTLHAGGERIYGEDVLAVAPDDALQPALFERDLAGRGDTVRVSPAAPGEHALRVSVAGRPLPPLPLLAVGPDRVAGARVHGPRIEGGFRLFGHKSGWVVGEAYDASGATIHGAPFRWAVGGERFAGEGPGFSYKHSEDAALQTVTAQIGEHQAQATIQYLHGGGVIDLDSKGCASSPGAGPLAALLPLLALLGRRRA